MFLGWIMRRASDGVLYGANMVLEFYKVVLVNEDCLWLNGGAI